MAKFFTKRRINLEAITRMLKIMWRSRGSFDIHDLGNNTIMVLFDDEDDAKRILMRGPWSFNKYSGLFHPGEATTMEDSRFDTATFCYRFVG